MSKLREIVEMPWILLNCGFWIANAFVRGQKIKYYQWRIKRLKEKISLNQQMKKEIDR